MLSNVQGPQSGARSRYDYVSPSFEALRLDDAFPHMQPLDPTDHPWPYLRREVPHIWYADARFPLMGFLNRDEAVLLHNIALGFAGNRALEIGCWMGWSTCHLALAGVSLDVIDPALLETANRTSVESALETIGKRDAVTLHPSKSPEGVRDLIEAGAAPWSLFFVDGDHITPGPELDVEVCLANAAPDCAFVFHDLAAPDVGFAIRQLEARGFNVLLYQTAQIMGLAWRGAVRPVEHIPDPALPWQLPHHLVGLPVSGVSFGGYPVAVRERAVSQAALLADKTAEVERLAARVTELTDRLNNRPTFGQRVKTRLRRLAGLAP